MTGDTMRALSQYMADLHRQERERNKKTYSKVYESATTDTNGVKKDWDDKEEQN